MAKASKTADAQLMMKLRTINARVKSVAVTIDGIKDDTLDLLVGRLVPVSDTGVTISVEDVFASIRENSVEFLATGRIVAADGQLGNRYYTVAVSSIKSIGSAQS